MPVMPAPTTSTSTPSSSDENVIVLIREYSSQLFEQLGVTLLDELAAAVAPRRLAVPELLVHERRVGHERAPRLGGVLEDRLLADEFAYVGAVVLDGDDFVSAPVDDQGRNAARFECGDAEPGAIGLEDGPRVIGLVRMESYRLALDDPVEPIAHRAAVDSRRTADPDDRGRDLEAAGEIADHRFVGHLGEGIGA